MAYVITDGEGYLAGKRVYRDPHDKRKIIALWSGLKEDAMVFTSHITAEHMRNKLAIPELEIIPESP